MNKIILTILVVFGAISCTTTSKYQKRQQNKPFEPLIVRTTAYSHTESDHIKYGRKSAVGTKLVATSHLNSAAADWSEFPVGTQFRIRGYPKVYVIDDYGSALVGTKTIDIYRPSKAGIKSWGVKFVEIEIVKWGSYSSSRAIIQDRKKFAHIRKMDNNLINKQKEG